MVCHQPGIHAIGRKAGVGLVKKTRDTKDLAWNLAVADVNGDVRGECTLISEMICVV